MSLNSQIIRQRDFSGGAIDPDAIRRDDIELLQFSVRDALNLVSTHTGGIMRRPGRRVLFRANGVVTEFKPFDDISYMVVFIAGGVRVRMEDGSLVAALSGPWADADLDTLVVEAMDNEIFVTWDGAPRVITVSKTNRVWSIATYAFSTGVDGAVRMPFYRFAETVNVTMKPSARTGNITVDFSANILNTAHVGSVFRYAGRQIRITSRINARRGNAVVIEELPPTYDITVPATAGFSIGQVVETDTTNMKGSVIGVTTTVITIVVQDKLSTPQAGEMIVSPSGSAKITSFVAAASPGASPQWDEQFISSYRGFPRSVAKDRQRLIFSNFPQFKSAIIWSATGDNRDMAIGSQPDDAIFEYISAECQVFHVVGGYDEFVITDKGVYYIPISVGTPLQPGSVEFRPIFSQELANVRPIEVTEGVIFIDKGRSGIYAISATGQTARPYIANELNRYSKHLFRGVTDIAVSSGTRNFPTRQIYAVNEDGTVVVGQFNPDRDYVGWLPWDNGRVRSVTGTYGRVIFITRHTLNGADVVVAEEIDYDLLCDCATEFGRADQTDFLSLSNGKPLDLRNGDRLTLSGAVVGFYAGLTVDVFGGGFYLGRVKVSESGIVNGFSDYETLTIGVSFDWSLRPLFTRFDDGQPVGQGEKRRKIELMQLTVRDTQEFEVGQRVFGSYRGGEDMSLPVPARDDTYKYRETGRSYDPDVLIKSTFPGKFKMIELATRITV